jgi:hypothetical protein
LPINVVVKEHFIQQPPGISKVIVAALKLAANDAIKMAIEPCQPFIENGRAHVYRSLHSFSVPQDFN